MNMTERKFIDLSKVSNFYGIFKLRTFICMFYFSRAHNGKATSGLALYACRSVHEVFRQIKRKICPGPIDQLHAR